MTNRRNAFTLQTLYYVVLKSSEDGIGLDGLPKRAALSLESPFTSHQLASPAESVERRRSILLENDCLAQLRGAGSDGRMPGYQRCG